MAGFFPALLAGAAGIDQAKTRALQQAQSRALLDQIMRERQQQQAIGRLFGQGGAGGLGGMAQLPGGSAQAVPPVPAAAQPASFDGGQTPSYAPAPMSNDASGGGSVYVPGNPIYATPPSVPAGTTTPTGWAPDASGTGRGELIRDDPGYDLERLPPPTSQATTPDPSTTSGDQAGGQGGGAQPAAPTQEDHGAAGQMLSGQGFDPRQLLDPNYALNFSVSIAKRIQAANPGINPEILAGATTSLVKSLAAQDRIGSAYAIAALRHLGQQEGIVSRERIAAGHDATRTATVQTQEQGRDRRLQTTEEGKGTRLQTQEAGRDRRAGAAEEGKNERARQRREQQAAQFTQRLNQAKLIADGAQRQRALNGIRSDLQARINTMIQAGQATVYDEKTKKSRETEEFAELKRQEKEVIAELWKTPGARGQ